MSKVQKESKSQPTAETLSPVFDCCDRCQRYKKKANHNYCVGFLYKYNIVVIDVKGTKRKQITTVQKQGAVPDTADYRIRQRCDAIMLNISWMMFGMVITFYNIMEK